MLLWKAHEYTANLIRYWIKYQLFWLENRVMFFFFVIVLLFLSVFRNGVSVCCYYSFAFLAPFYSIIPSWGCAIYIFSSSRDRLRSCILSYCNKLYMSTCYKICHGQSLIPFYPALSLSLYFVRAYAAPIFTIYYYIYIYASWEN